MQAKRSTRWARRGGVTMSVLAALALISTACGGSSTKSSSPPTSAATSNQTTAPASSSNQAANGVGDPAALLQKGYAGTFGTPPTNGPKAIKGKNVWIISCGQAASSCSVPAAAMQAAADAAGWHVTLFDGQLNTAREAQGITQAVAAGAQGIMTVGVNCQDVPAPLSQAKAAGIKTVTIGASDCNSSFHPSGPSEYTTRTIFNGGMSWEQALQSWGALKAAWIINQTQGKAQLIEITGTELFAPDEEHVGFMAEMAKCGGCKVVDTVDLSLSDLAGSGEQSKVLTALQQHPEATAVDIFADGFQAPVNQAIQSLGRNNLVVMGGECFAPTPDEIRGHGPENACVSYPQEWAGWASVDELNRQFADPGSQPVDEGMGFQIVDKTHNLPAGPQWEAPVNFKSAYQKLWGVS